MKDGLILFLGLLIFQSCNGDLPEEMDMHNPPTAVRTEAEQDTSRVLKVRHEEKKFPEVISFKQSECKEDCELIERMTAKTLSDHILSLSFLAIRDCDTPYKVDSIIHKKNLIDIQMSSAQPERITECYCLYTFDLKIKHIDTLPTAVRLNGRSINRTLIGR